MNIYSNEETPSPNINKYWTWMLILCDKNSFFNFLMPSISTSHQLEQVIIFIIEEF
jgi:hypothetical protein